MRMGTQSGCFELDNVVTIGTTPSTKSPKVFVQDAAGGAFTAMMTRCSSTSTAHPCAVAATVAALTDGRSVTVKGTYIKSTGSGFEEFFIDAVTDNGAGTIPAAGTATLADIERGGTNKGLAFQKVTVSIPSADTLVMYDWTPAELVYTGATTCPYQFGWSMIPKSVTGITAGAACTSGTAQPTSQATPNAASVIIGTDFYKGFTFTSDCRCAKMFNTTNPVVPAAGSTIAGSISGILIFDVPFGASVGYYYIAPKTNADAALTGAVPGM
jgi:hypothetical protein